MFLLFSYKAITNLHTMFWKQRKLQLKNQDKLNFFLLKYAGVYAMAIDNYKYTLTKKYLKGPIP